MRLMLGSNNQPSLLVSVEQEYAPDHFEFWVVNGAWNGTFRYGNVTVWQPWEPWTSLAKTEVLCDNQDRLRGEYQTVFNNFDNPDYVAPKPEKFVLPAGWDDDIAF